MGTLNPTRMSTTSQFWVIVFLYTIQRQNITTRLDCTERPSVSMAGLSHGGQVIVTHLVSPGAGDECWHSCRPPGARACPPTRAAAPKLVCHRAGPARWVRASGGRLDNAVAMTTPAINAGSAAGTSITGRAAGGNRVWCSMPQVVDVVRR